MSKPFQPSVKVFGSAILRVAPDTASIVVAVTSLEPLPESAFTGAREAARAINGYLRDLGIAEFGSSRMTLSQETRYVDGTHEFAGYKARIAFNVVLRDMDRVDEVLAGLITAGANELNDVTFQTTRLKELRAEARRRAVAAARDKAELYCHAAGVAAGRALKIVDVSPDVLSGRGEGHSYREATPADDTGEVRAIDPAAITVGAAVTVVYEIVVA